MCNPLTLLMLTGLAPLNLAPLATPATSYVSPHESLDAFYQTDEPRDSADKSRLAYGNWPRTGVQWVDLVWHQPISTDAIEVYWYDDQRGVRLPASSRLLAWLDGDWRPVPGAGELGRTRNAWHRLDFPAVRTDRLRLELTGDGEYSTGIIRWRVYDSGATPNFAPRVTAGHDRVAVVGGPTWLTGTVADDGKPGGAPRLAWSRAAGPGEVAIAPAGDGAWEATFAAPGEYRLRLTADDGELSGSDELAVRVVPAAFSAPLAEAPLAPFSLGPGLWRERVKAVIEQWIPHLIAKLNDPDLAEGGLNNYLAAAEKLAGRDAPAHRGYPWADAYLLNAIESISLALLVEPGDDADLRAAQDHLRATLDVWVPAIVAAQEPDGYFDTLTTLSGAPRWAPQRRGMHEGYVAGYFIDAGLAHAALVGPGRSALYAATRRLADCWVRNVGAGPGQVPWWDGHETFKISLTRLADEVAAREGPAAAQPYRDLVSYMLATREGGAEYDQSHVLPIHQYEAVGHSVRAAYLYAAVADEARLTQDPAWLGAALSQHANVAERKLFVTGGLGSGETSEGFGPDWSLAQGAYAETCAGCATVFWQQSLLRTAGAGEHGDLSAAALYNNVLGGLDLEGRNFTYTNALDSSEARYPWHVCPCCVGNVSRVLLELPRWTYARGPGALWVNHYLAAEMDAGPVSGTPVRVRQETNYPWDGRVVLTVEPRSAKQFALHLRLPAATAPALYPATPVGEVAPVSLRVNGAVQPVVARDGYVTVERLWQPGDTVELELPLPIERLRADERVGALQGLVALRRGPLVYTFESVDQPLDQALAADAPLRAEWRPELLGGVMAIVGEWADGSPLLAVPNYARLNRGGRAVVWVQEQP